MRKLVATLVIGAVMAFGAVEGAEAQVAIGGGLVVVQVVDVIDIGDIEIVVQNIGIGVGAQIAAQICGLQVGNVGIIAQQVARQGQHTVCQIEQDGEMKNVQIARNR